MERTIALIIVEQSRSGAYKDLNKARSKGFRAMKMKCFLFPQSGSALFVSACATPITLSLYHTHSHTHTHIYSPTCTNNSFIQAHNGKAGPAYRLGLYYADVSAVYQSVIFYLTAPMPPREIRIKRYLLKTLLLPLF